MTAFKLPRTLANAILTQAQHSPKHEICGLLGGRNKQAQHCYPIDNTAADPTCRYQMNPEQQINAIRQMRERDEDLLAIYHSHPYSPAMPSAIDIAEAEYPETVYLIISLNTGGVLEMKAFHIKDRQVSSVMLELI